MKAVTLTLSIFCALCAVCVAGPERYSGKEMKETAAVAPPCTEWYADREWNVSVWGTYTFTETESERTAIELADDFSIFGKYDRFLGGDHAWGGGVDVKYFICRYFGFGIEGFALAGNGKHALFDEGPNPPVSEEIYADNDHTVGAVLGTFTLRYPFHCSRFSPYLWAGGGGIFGGRNDHTFVQVSGGSPFSASENEEESRVLGQFGGGLEFRITRHIGITGDFSWNVLEGPHNNFGMVRSGLNFAF